MTIGFIGNKKDQLEELMTNEGLNANNSKKPTLPGSGYPGAIYSPRTGEQLTDSWEDIINRNKNNTNKTDSDDPNSGRIGDYVPSGRGWKVVENSPTDIVQKYVTSDARAKQDLTITDWFNAIKSSMFAASGLPTEQTNLATMIGSGIVSGVMRKAPPLLRGLWAISNAAQSLMNADSEYLREYLNQDFNYELAGDFTKDKDGKLIFIPNYKKMAGSGSESGSAVKSALETGDTNVKMDKDNQLDISVSPVFAQSEEYSDALKTISDAYGSLTKEQADQVVDEDTGMTRIESIDKYIKSIESNYLYNAVASKDIKEHAPTASDESMNIALEVSKIGYLDEKILKDTQVSVYNENNELYEVNAKEYLDSISNKDKLGREDYMLSLGNRIADENISDDEKAVLYAQSMTLYAASNSDGPYKGMYLKGFDDEIGSAREVFSGLPFNSFVGNRELTTFQTNEFYAGALDLALSYGSVKALTGATNMIEKGVRGITPKLSNWAGGDLKTVIEEAHANAGASGAGKAVATAGLKGLTQVGYQLSADAIYDALKAIPYAATGNFGDYNFVDELKSDAAIDFLVTFGPSAFVGDMESPKYERRVLVEDSKTGKEMYKSFSDLKKDTSNRYTIVYGKEGGYIDETLDAGPYADGEASKLPDYMGGGYRDVRYVQLTGEELAKRRADTIRKLTSTKLGTAVEKMFFDKNVGMSKLAVEARAKAGKYLYQKMLRYSGDIRQVTQDTLREFMGKESVDQHWKDLKQQFRDLGVTKLSNFSKQDWNYIKAVTNEYRFLAKNEGDKNAEKIIKNFYKEGKKGVSKERVKQLNKLMGSMRAVAADVVDFYVEKGLMSEKDAKKLRSDPAYETGMYLPMYLSPKRKLSSGGDVSQERAMFKKIKNAEALIKLDDLDNPLNSLARYINNGMRAVAINDRALAIREVANLAGVNVHVVEDTGGSMREFQNLKKYDSGFRKIYSDIRKDVLGDKKKNIPGKYQTLEQWTEQNSGLVMRSKALKTANELESLQKDAVELRKQVSRARYRYNKAKNNLNSETNKNLKQASLFDNTGEQSKKKPQKLVDSINEERKAAQELQDAKTLVEENKQAQLFTVDRLKYYTGLLMKRAAKLSKSEAKLDIRSYLNVQITNGLKNAIKANNSTGKIQNVINDAVTKANPWVDPEVVIKRRAEAAAIRYRNKVFEDLKAQNEKAKEKMGIEKINAMADQITDKIISKLTREKPAEVTFIDDEGYATKLLDNYGHKNTIRYKINGKEERMVLSGDGAEELVSEFYAPEFTAPKTTIGKVWRSIYRTGNRIAQLKRYLTTSAVALRMPANVMRDFARGTATTGGQILMSKRLFFNSKAAEVGEAYGPEAAEKVRNGLMLAYGAVDESTLTSSLMMPGKNRAKSMVRAMIEPDGNAFVRFVFDIKNADFNRALSAVQDYGESLTRKAAMESAYSKEIANAQSRHLSVDEAIKRATEAAYFAGREATTNFFRRGTLIAKVAQQVPYLTQKFANLESFKYSYLNDPIGVSRALRTTVSGYTALIAIALSNEESRKRYYLLSEYDRSNNIIIPLTNGMIMTIPLDETIAAFLTPYRRMVETLNGVDPEAFYLCFAEGLTALSPIDLSGFSEGDGFNVARGFEKIGAEFIPTWALPFIESATGKSFYYGSSISVDSDYTGMMNDNWTPTPGELTKNSKNSKTLKIVADHTQIPQWILQNFLSEYGGTIGENVLWTIDKLQGATADEQGGKEWMDPIFKAFTGSDSDEVTSAFYDALNSLQADKKSVQNKIKTLNSKIDGASGEEKAELINQRQKIISDYGIHVTDTLSQYLSAYEITGGLSKKMASRAWHLYRLYDESSNRDLFMNASVGDYYTDKANSWINDQASNLASKSEFDTIARSPVSAYYDTYAEETFKKSLYGDPTSYVAIMDDVLKKSGLQNEYYDTISPLVDKYYKENNWDAKDDLLEAWDKKVMRTIVAEFEGEDLTEVLKKSEVLDLLDNYIKPPSGWERNKYGRYISAPRLNKSRGFAPSYIQAIYDELKKEKK